MPHKAGRACARAIGGRLLRALAALCQSADQLGCAATFVVAHALRRYKELQNEIQSEEGITNSSFIRINSSPLKTALADHCHGWQVMFTNLLNDNAYAELASIYNHMNKVGSTFKKKPLNLDQLAEQLNVLRGEQAEIEKHEARFEPLQEQYVAPPLVFFLPCVGRAAVTTILPSRRTADNGARPHKAPRSVLAPTALTMNAPFPLSACVRRSPLNRAQIQAAREVRGDCEGRRACQARSTDNGMGRLQARARRR